MSSGGEGEGGGYDGTRGEMDRAIRNLGVLENLFLMIAAITSLIAGALVAWLLNQSTGAPFRITWAISSLALFIVPGFLSWLRVRREEREEAERKRRRESEST